MQKTNWGGGGGQVRSGGGWMAGVGVKVGGRGEGLVGVMWGVVDVNQE